MVIISPAGGSAVYRHDNHNPGASFASRSFAAPAEYMLIRNIDSSAAVQLSFDGTNGFTINAGEAVAFELKNQKTYYTKKVSGSPAVEVLYGTES